MQPNSEARVGASGRSPLPAAKLIGGNSWRGSTGSDYQSFGGPPWLQGYSNHLSFWFSLWLAPNRRPKSLRQLQVSRKGRIHRGTGGTGNRGHAPDLSGPIGGSRTVLVRQGVCARESQLTEAHCLSILIPLCSPKRADLPRPVRDELVQGDASVSEVAISPCVR